MLLLPGNILLRVYENFHKSKVAGAAVLCMGWWCEDSGIFGVAGFISNEHPAEEPVAGSGQKAQNGAVVSSGNGLNAEAKSGSARWMGDSSQGYHPTVWLVSLNYVL